MRLLKQHNETAHDLEIHIMSQHCAVRLYARCEARRCLGAVLFLKASCGEVQLLAIIVFNLGGTASEVRCYNIASNTHYGKEKTGRGLYITLHANGVVFRMAAWVHLRTAEVD